MSPSSRLTQLEKILQLRYETLGEAEMDLAMTTNTFDKTAIKQRIREQILPELRKYEVEYWNLLAQEAQLCSVEEVDARNSIVQVVREVELIKKKLNVNYPDDFMELLLEIRDKLNQPGTPAMAKAKLALPLIPGILSYELELDTESSLRRAFQPIKTLFKGALKKN
ncbi:hypothetical protein BV372_12105 [Nostoc sp. T09]|uniref:hypothetical protein n=1 Tax=Nostoc sp. T09 TaxID=1932621 RepID=UPI000A38A47D|nr:hypothetical protein [Nostoc sp. T09]OUL35093.1 hypothetical protein BV372_12105 [Nostoc sp. T09]